MIIRLKEKINSVCDQYTAHKHTQMDVIKYDDRIEVYYCKTPFAKDESIVYEVCKESAEVVVPDNMKSPDDWVMTEQQKPKPKKKPPSKYHRENTLRDKDFVDFYDIINLLQSNGEQIPPEIQHALKKLMYNDRGHKNMVQDKKEASWSIDRWLQNNEL